MSTRTTRPPRATARRRPNASFDVPEAPVPLSSRLRPEREADRMTRVYRTIGGGLVADFGRD